MSNFLSDLTGAFTGQQTTPQSTIIPTSDLLNQSYGAAAAATPAYLAYQKPLATGLTDIQLGVANQIDPSILGNYRGANQSILDQLNMGTNMSPELQAEITRGLLSTNAASGFGASAGGAGNIYYQTAMDKQNLLRQRQQDALNAGTNGLGISHSFYQPSGFISPEAIAGDIRGVQSAKDELANTTEQIRQNNFKNLLSTGFKIAGGIAGSFAGPGGAMIGSNIGGSLIQGGGVGGSYGQPQQSNGFGSFLNGIFGNGTPQYGNGAGQQYANNEGDLLSSVKASPVALPFG